MAANGLESLTRAQTETCIDRVFKRVANKSMFTMYALILYVGITDHNDVGECAGGWRGAGLVLSPSSSPLSHGLQSANPAIV